MIVSYRRIGGFAPVFQGCVLDSTGLPAADGEQLVGLVRASGLEMLRDVRIAGADLQTIFISVEEDGKTISRKFDVAAVPESVRALVGFLEERAGDLLP